MDYHQNPPQDQPTNSSIPPNRKNFEQRIWQINNKLAKLQEQMRSYWKEEKRTKFGELKEKLDNAKREYGLEAEEELKLMEGLRELEGKVQGKQREVHEMEECADLIYKSMPMAKQKLAQLEGQFKERKFTNIRDEQMWVAQMDKMQRNIGRLAKYLPLVEQKRMLEMELREKRRRVREVRQKMRMHKDEAGECRRQIGGMQQPFRRLRETLAELRAEKRELVERYNAQMDEYRKWARDERTRKAQIGGGSFPSASFLQQDSDSLDLFHSQKTACTRLITYLNGLKEFGESRVEAKEKDREIKFELHKKEGEEDSGEELPEAFQKHFNLGDGQKGRNKLEEDVRKLAKKQAMPLSHGIDWIRLFGEIEVPPPRTHADVPGVLREVQRMFQFYKDQTAEQEEEEDEANGGCPDWAMMGLSGYSSTLTSPTGLSSSLLSPASFASYSPRLSFAHQQNKANKEEPEIWTEDEPCSSSAESSIGKTSEK